jgi:hypothetical protein
MKRFLKDKRYWLSLAGLASLLLLLIRLIALHWLSVMSAPRVQMPPADLLHSESESDLAADEPEASDDPLCKSSVRRALR